MSKPFAPIDLSPLGDARPETIDPTNATVQALATAIDEACRTVGFFTITGFGVAPTLLGDLDTAARTFFACDEATKQTIAMARGGRAWRGWFGIGDEHTAGVVDQKEGLYFGAELGLNDPKVQAGTLLHGPNLFPDSVPALRPLVLDTIEALTAVGQRVLALMAIGLGLTPQWFATNLTADPLVLLRIFRYPPTRGHEDDVWGVGEHTDYGLLTLLTQDALGGLQVRTHSGWYDVPPTPDTLVCNIGDMFERLTAGRYRSTPHRVRNATEHDRISIPFFLDPSWQSAIAPLPIAAGHIDADANVPPRWDRSDPRAFTGTYGDYITAKVAKVFPALIEQARHGGLGSNRQ